MQNKHITRSCTPDYDKINRRFPRRMEFPGINKRRDISFKLIIQNPTTRLHILCTKTVLLDYLVFNVFHS